MSRTARVTEATLLASIIACGSTNTPVTTPPPPHVAALIDGGASAPIDAAFTPTIQRGGDETRLEAPHAGTITDLAVTPDGTAALSVDDQHGARLWPALDGTLEPRVVHLPRPAQLALGPDPKGFAIGLIDEAGGLVIQVIDRDGLLVQRATLGIEPTFAGIAMTERGLLAWRSDHRILRYTSDGAITAQLSAEPGQRVLAIAAATGRGVDRAIAVIEGSTDDKTWKRARWLQLGDKLSWGAWIAKAGDSIGAPIAISPSARRFAYLSGDVPNAMRVTAIDASTGAQLHAQQASFAQVLELPDDDHVVYSGQSTATIQIALATPVPKALPMRGMAAIASGGGKLIAGSQNELAIATGDATQFLGYGVIAPQVSAVAGNGRLAVGTNDRAVLLDGKLVSTPLDVIPDGQVISALRWLGGDEWAAVTTDGTQAVLWAVDAARHKRSELRKVKGAAIIDYEPSTQLLTLSNVETNEVMHYEPGKLRVDPIATLSRAVPFESITLWPVPPASAGGTQLIVSQKRATATLRWVADPRKLTQGPTTDGSIAAVDATGRVFAWQQTASLDFELVAVRDGKKLGTLAIDPAANPLWPDPTGDRIATSGGAKLAVLGSDGSRKWSRPLPGISSVHWLTDGSLAAITGVGIARLDAATGEPLALRCGWGFGLSPKQHPTSGTHVPSLCMQGGLPK